MSETEPLRDIVLRVQRGDQEAFEILVSRTEALARKIAFTRVPAHQLDDVLQESYLLVYRKLICLKEPDKFTSWFGRLVLHVCHDFHRKKKTTETLHEEMERSGNPEEVLDVMSLRKALHQLEAKDRDILILREMLELSYKEVAEALRLKVGTVRSRLHKARANLAARLGGS